MLSKASLNQVSGTSLNEKRVADSFARPMALKEKTQQSLAQQKANPRPPSSIGRKPAGKNRAAKPMLAENSSGDDYSDNYEENDFDEGGDDNIESELKLKRLREAMQREKITATKVVTKHNIQVLKSDEASRKVLKMGPATGKTTVTMDQIQREVEQMQTGPQLNLK